MSIAVEQLLTSDILRPARYLGNELGAVHKPWQVAQVRWVLTYPEIYEVGASNLGHIILYSILNAQPRQLCDRAYLPAPDLAAKLKATQTPLFAVESRQPLTEFDILGFSLSYELGATNILEMLHLAGIPLTWKDRSAPGAWNVEQGYPLIFAGGQTATSNPEPYADFFDFIALGDGEELLPEIGLVVEEGKAAGLSREELLLDLAQIPGVYVPQFYTPSTGGAVHPNRDTVPKRVLRRVAPPMPTYSIGLVPFVETVHDRLIIEIRRGCTRGCRFCQPGMLTRPARDVEPEQVIDTIERGMRETGYNEFSLLSLSCSDYLALPAVGLEIKNRLKDENISLSLPSQRVDRFDENIANIIGGTRKGGLTFAPEAGTQRLRDIINKGLTNEELLRGVQTAYEQGWDKVKLYFMIGLPGETDADVLGIAETMRWLQQMCRAKGRRPIHFNVTISNFTPKPHTPFQWHSVSTAEFERKQALLRQEFRTIRGLKANFTDVRISAMEDFVGRGDRRLCAVIHRAWELGAREDSWWENQERAFGAWTQAIAESGLTWKYRQVESGEWNLFGKDKTGGDEKDKGGGMEDVACFCPAVEETSEYRDVAGRDIEPETQLSSSLYPSTFITHPSYLAPLPWDHIDSGVDKTWLQEDLKRALEAATVPDCSFDDCSHCGVCGADFGHNVVVPPLPIPRFDHHFVPNTKRSQRLRVWFGKLYDMALISHLDLVRLFDRAIRRAALPVAYTGGFHPSPRIVPASALPLGATSCGEVVDFDLSTTIEPEEFLVRLAAQLPHNVPLYRVKAIAPNTPAATQLLERAEYYLSVGLVPEDETTAVELVQQPQRWIEAVLATSEIIYEQTTKSGKQQQINLRDRLFELDLLNDNAIPTPFVQAATQNPSITLRYVGSCRNNGTLLRPEHLVYMLEQASRQQLQLLHSHRNRLEFSL